MQSTKQIRAQLESAYVLLGEDTTTIEKLEKIKSLLLGINPSLDKKLTEAGNALNHLQAAFNTDIIHLTPHALPELTPADKKRKKLLILFITSWKSLRSEVKRVQGYYAGVKDGSPAQASGSIVKTGLFAKGPFGLITIAAVAIVGIGLLLKQATTTVEIQNLGCPPLAVPQMEVKIPGIKLPGGPIVAGNPEYATLPTMTLIIQTNRTHLTVNAFNQTVSYTFPNHTSDVRFDDASLLDRTTTLKLGSSRSHSLTIECK